MAPALFSTTYFGPITWWAAVVQHHGPVLLEAQENYVKQSYRTRCYIDSPNGTLSLNLPTAHSGAKGIKETKIAYQENWPAKHWQALQTTYKNSPFFETIGPSIKEVYDLKHTTLWALNEAFRKLLFYWLRLNIPLEYTQQYEVFTDNTKDFRQLINPKEKRRLVKSFPPYPQVFEAKAGFKPNLCVLDLLFNEGPAAYDYLAQLEFVN